MNAKNTLLVAGFALIAFGLMAPRAAHGCSDPEQHKIHLRQEMEAALKEKRGTGGGTSAPTFQPPQSSLDSADSFFKNMPSDSSAGDSRRNRR